MPAYQFCNFSQELPNEAVDFLTQNDNKIVVVGIIGKSCFPNANKMLPIGVKDTPNNHEVKEGNIQFYFNRQESMLLLHFETTYDAACVQKMLEEDLEQQRYEQFMVFQQKVRNRFARMLLFATHVCHLLVYVELSVTFDASLLSMFSCLKIIRDKHVLKFLPKLIKNSNFGTLLGKSTRLCSPRILFLFENYPQGYEQTNESISKLEFEVEDNIYKMLRNEFIITNNSAASLFSIPGNKRFVYYNTNGHLRDDPLLKTIGILDNFLTTNGLNEDDEEELNDLRPFAGFGISLPAGRREVKEINAQEAFLKERQFMNLLKDHVSEALRTGFDDNLTKFKGKSHFVLMSGKTWLETFRMLHKIFIENADNTKFEANDPDYKAYLENFDKILNIDNEFFKSCCDIGLQKAFAMYNNPTLTHYSGAMHKKLVEEAIILYAKYAKGPQTHLNEQKLREMCEKCWQNGKQQCEFSSLRGFPCIMPKHIVQDAAEHSSGVVFVSVCNCGRTQGRREDPYTLRHANYEFYEYMAKNCTLCAKVRKINFAVFEPSINDYRAAEFEIAFPKLSVHDDNLRHVTPEDEQENDASQPLTAEGSHANLSLESTDNIKAAEIHSSDDDDDSLNELVLHLKDKNEPDASNNEHSIYRQASTTEYLPGMVHTESPPGLLPQFPSWSLVCVGASSIYSHSTGLMEHFQTGFLSGANFLLPWDVHVRLQHSAWTYEKSRYRKMGEVFVLKIFVGFEYECPRGHRFMMSSPDKVLRGGSAVSKDGSKVVFNNMPLYFPCPCRSKLNVAQLMRIHVVTPKAPVNVILDPKVRTGNNNYTFTLGMPQPPKLSQSAYWILRLPYVYQVDDTPIMPPLELPSGNTTNYGCLLAGMFGVTETEVDD